MAYLEPAASSKMPHVSSYKSVALDEIELNGNTHSQIYHSTWHIRGHTYQNRVCKRNPLEHYMGGFESRSVAMDGPALLLTYFANHHDLEIDRIACEHVAVGFH